MDNGGAAAASSAGSCKAGDGVSDQFPAGLRVLVVDDDLTCLKILEKMLQICQYEVTTCSRAVDALALLRTRKGGFDVVLSDVYMPDIDGFKLLECIGLEMDLPVIMMSADDGNEVVMKGVTHGACDYLIKPVRIEALKNIWQHVVRKRRNELKEIEQSISVDDSDKHKKPSDDADYACSANEGSWKHSKRRKDIKDEDDEGEDREDSSTLKKPRVVWSVELHQQFVAAVNQLGIDKAVPKKIMELMNVPGLTRENVASHLQKYRLYLRRLSGVPQHQGGINTPYLGAPEATFGSNTSFDRFGLQALAVPSQFPPQNLAALQAGLGRTTVSTGMGMPLVDQMDFQNSDAQSSSTSKIRFGLGQQLSNKQGNALHGLPPPMEPRLLPYSQQPVQSFGNTGLQVTEGTSDLLGLPTSLVRTGSSSHMEILHRQPSGSLMMQMTQQRPQVPISHNQNQIQVDRSQQPQLNGQLLVEIPGVLASGISSSIGQQMLPNEISGQVFGRNGAVLNGRGSSSYSAASQAACVNFPISTGMELSENVFPRLTATGLSNVPLMGMFQESAPVAVCLEGLESVIDPKKSIGPSSGYHLPNEFRLNKSRVWDVQNFSHAYDGTQNASSSQSKPVDVQPVLAHQVLASSQKNMQNINLAAGSKEMPLGRVEGGRGNSVTMDQYHNKILVDNSFRVKAENMLGTDSFAQDDIMDELFKQQQEGFGLVDSEFDGYSIDNIPV